MDAMHGEMKLYNRCNPRMIQRIGPDQEGNQWGPKIKISNPSLRDIARLINSSRAFSNLHPVRPTFSHLSVHAEVIFADLGRSELVYSGDIPDGRAIFGTERR
jgi:hypothetical protein